MWLLSWLKSLPGQAASVSEIAEESKRYTGQGFLKAVEPVDALRLAETLSAAGLVDIERGRELVVSLTLAGRLTTDIPRRWREAHVRSLTSPVGIMLRRLHLRLDALAGHHTDLG